MDYKKMMGYGKKKKVKKQPKPKVNQVLESIKSEFGFKNEEKLNETLPAFPKEWKNVEKSVMMLEKSVKMLEKAVSKVDKSHSRTISGLWKYTSNNIKKFKDLLAREVLGKLQ
jgi:hypothetical protein